MIGGELFAYKLGAPSEKREVVGRMAGTTQEQQLVVFPVDHRDSLCGVATRGLLHHPANPTRICDQQPLSGCRLASVMAVSLTPNGMLASN
jgi:hypothetical protein